MQTKTINHLKEHTCTLKPFVQLALSLMYASCVCLLDSSSSSSYNNNNNNNNLLSLLNYLFFIIFLFLIFLIKKHISVNENTWEALLPFQFF